MDLTPIYNPPERPNLHPICLLMPSADEDELQNLTDDIHARGLLDPIVLFEKRILDGRNRAAACESAGVAPRYVEFQGTREEALMFVVSHNLKRRHLTKQAIADTLVEAEDFNLHYELGEAATLTDIKMSAQKPKKTASSRELAKAAGGAVSREMINATRKVKEKAIPEMQEAVKKGRIGVQDAAKVADLPPEQQKAIAASPKPRRAANVAIEAAKNATTRSASDEGDPCAALRKAWEKATAVRRLWEAADNSTREWFMGVVWFDLNEADYRKRSAIESLDEPADKNMGEAAG